MIKPKISVIIPTLNEEKNIKQLLQDLQQQTQIPDQIIVVDAGSSDRTCDIVTEFKQVHCLHSHPPVGGQRTQGGKFASGDLLFFIDADVRVPENYIKSMSEEFFHRNLDCACPWYIPHHSRWDIYLIFLLFNIIFWLTQWCLPSGAGMAILVNKNLFSQIGGFKPEYTFDDIAFIRQSGRQGKFRIINQAVYVSDRRFRTYGTLKMLVTYLLLSIFFTFGLFKQANLIRYKFGGYK